ncbi:cuticle protein AM1199-like [Homarus americanus]|uniref:cuticle protein AM1199-like n=1 Tax=Homarus americanus TaxID=6706 RepID=UPI001C43FFBD|nr:cuticle protein AM1199-like [Homarus americanus]
MKLVILACLAAVAVAAPQFSRHYTHPYHPDYRHIAILRDDRQDNGDGNFRYDFETENGIAVSAVGRPGSRGQSNIQGSYRFPFPSGGYGEVRYVADELGYRPSSPLIPTPHPLPAHAIEQIRIAEDQRRRGITFQ